MAIESFEHLDPEPFEESFDLDPTSTGPLTAIGWLAFVVLLLVSPALVWAVWGWAL